MINKILIPVLFAFVATTAFADAFADLDADKDGLISKDEAAASQTVMQKWDTLDVNQDGYLGADEFSVLTGSDQ